MALDSLPLRSLQRLDKASEPGWWTGYFFSMHWDQLLKLTPSCIPFVEYFQQHDPCRIAFCTLAFLSSNSHWNMKMYTNRAEWIYNVRNMHIPYIYIYTFSLQVCGSLHLHQHAHLRLCSQNNSLSSTYNRTVSLDTDPFWDSSRLLVQF